MNSLKGKKMLSLSLKNTKDKVPIAFEFNEEIFYLFSFLNLIGYDHENNRKGMHPLRKSVRQQLKEKIKINRYSLLKKYISKKHQGQFVGWLLRKKYTPKEIEKAFSKRELSFFKEFDKAFKEFIEKEKENLPWDYAKNLYLQEKSIRYKKIVKELNDLAGFLNISLRLLNLDRIIIIPNFMDAYDRGYGPREARTAFIVYGPLKDEKFRLIRHEFLHSVIDPLALKNNVFLEKTKNFLKHSQPSKDLKKVGYTNWKIIFSELLIRAIDIKTTNLGKKEKKNFWNKRKNEDLIQLIKYILN